MKIGVISDTHDHLPGILKAHNVFIEHRVEMICHLGDWLAPFTMEFFDRTFTDWQVPVISIFGNNEGDYRGIFRRNNQLKNPIKFADKLSHTLEIEGLKVGMFHGHDQDLLQALVDSQKYYVILTGHTHQVRNEIVGKTLILNPGSVTPAAGSSILDHGSVAILTLPEKIVEIVALKED